MLLFNDFLDNLVLEELHPELHQVVSSSNTGYRNKQTLLANKVKELTHRGERTGIEGNMPKGSSRAYLKHDTPHQITLDGKPTQIHTGTKVAIRHTTLDKHHKHHEHDGLSLGALQNRAEGGDHWVNNTYRILTADHDKPGHFHTNKESGIFPPLLDHDHDTNEWTHIGHARDIKPGEFRKLTKTPEHPKGISHQEFMGALIRRHNQNNGKYHTTTPQKEAHLDHIDTHPLVAKFHDYHGNTGNPPHDLGQKKNMGVFEHPDGSHHIVARDHGYDTEVQHAYQKAWKAKHRLNGLY